MRYSVGLLPPMTILQSANVVVIESQIAQVQDEKQSSAAKNVDLLQLLRMECACGVLRQSLVESRSCSVGLSVGASLTLIPQKRRQSKNLKERALFVEMSPQGAEEQNSAAGRAGNHRASGGRTIVMRTHQNEFASTAESPLKGSPQARTALDFAQEIADIVLVRIHA